MSEIRKRVKFIYDSEKSIVKTSWFGNSAITNNGESAFQQPDCDILGYDGIQLHAARECLMEMLELVNAAIESK